MLAALVAYVRDTPSHIVHHTMPNMKTYYKMLSVLILVFIALYPSSPKCSGAPQYIHSTHTHSGDPHHLSSLPALTHRVSNTACERRKRIDMMNSNHGGTTKGGPGPSRIRKGHSLQTHGSPRAALDQTPLLGTSPRRGHSLPPHAATLARTPLNTSTPRGLNSTSTTRRVRGASPAYHPPPP